RLDSDVYTYGLVLNEGASLDLNGHTLYYLPLGQTYNGIATTTQCLGGTWYNGDIIPLSGNIIPEPGAIVLLGAGLFGLAGALRRGALRSGATRRGVPRTQDEGAETVSKVGEQESRERESRQ
ncbi:MAG: hypothetical protein DRP79_04445, partial [Planctomycetota bacterium]